MVRGRWWGGVLLVALLLLSGCGSGLEARSAPEPADGMRLHTVVSLPVFVSLVTAVGGERVAVRSLVPPGVDAHTYQPKPGDMRAVAGADVVFVNGAGLETWLAPLIRSAGGATVPVVDLAEGLHTIEDAQAGHDGHDHEQGNPHLWLDPVNAGAYAQRIAQVLGQHDPDGADIYRDNAARLAAEIEAFDAWAAEQIATIPPARRKLVTFHDAYPYFAAHFGLALEGVVVESPGKEPSPRQVARLIDLLRDEQIPALFIEPQFNPRLAAQIAREAGVRTEVLYSDTPPPGLGYLDMMRLNIEHVVEGLR